MGSEAATGSQAYFILTAESPSNIEKEQQISRTAREKGASKRPGMMLLRGKHTPRPWSTFLPHHLSKGLGKRDLDGPAGTRKAGRHRGTMKYMRLDDEREGTFNYTNHKPTVQLQH